jgi:acetate kinase
VAVLNVLVVNAGSTSLKLSLVGDGENGTPLASLSDAADVAVDIVGHRVVHGGMRFVEPVVIDDDVVRALTEVAELAPLHHGPALEAIAAARATLPDHRHVAVFDTAFHTTLPDVASTYAIPREWRDRGLRRFGFHGLSVQWAAERVPVSRLVVCHLGGGCSVTAVKDGRSVDTSMGLTPLEGVTMATRSGSVDPGLLVYLLRHGLSVAELEQGLEQESGLLGLSEGSADVRELEAAMIAGEERARLALNIFVRRIAQASASMAVSLGGLDGLVFTGGVGEHSFWVRERVCSELAFLGLALDNESNVHLRGDGEIAAADSKVRVIVVQSREDVVIARATRGSSASTIGAASSTG